MINVIYEDNHLLVVEKPVNIPVQGDSSNDEDLLTMLKQYLKKKYDKPGEVYLGLVHRLDRPVGGIMVFARTSKAASRLSKIIAERTFSKTYLAVVEGHDIRKSDTLTDYLIKDSKTNTVSVTDEAHGKKAVLDYELLNSKDDLNLVKVNLHTGRSHQIRVQFASRNMPLWGDQRYNPKAVKHQQIALWSYEISFPHPTTKEVLTFRCEPPRKYPWNELMPES